MPVFKLEVVNVLQFHSHTLLQKTAFSLAKSRLTLGSPSCLVVVVVVRRLDKNGLIHRKMVVDCLLVITSIFHR